MLYLESDSMKKIVLIVSIFIICLFLLIFGVNLYVVNSQKSKIYDNNSVNDTYDIGLVLGCSVLNNDTPSKMLKDRLDKTIELYNNSKINKIIVSGDHSDEYSEVEVMYNYLINAGIDENNIIKDNYGYSTSKSIKNYSLKYKDKSLIIITQKYHLYRALFLATRYNLNAIGVYAKEVSYSGDTYRSIREIIARNKDFFFKK